MGDHGGEVAATGMNDYIDIGIQGADTTDHMGRNHANFLYMKKNKFSRGEHELTIFVKGRPKSVSIDPLGFLIDRNPGDNVKNLAL